MQRHKYSRPQRFHPTFLYQALQEEMKLLLVLQEQSMKNKPSLTKTRLWIQLLSLEPVPDWVMLIKDSEDLQGVSGQVFFSNQYFSRPILVQIEQNGMQMKEEAWQFMLQTKSFRKHLFLTKLQPLKDRLFFRFFRFCYREKSLVFKITNFETHF